MLNGAFQYDGTLDYGLFLFDVSIGVRNAMVARLKALGLGKRSARGVSKFVVKPRPQRVDVATYNALAQAGAILVQNAGSRYETRSISLGAVAQEREMLFDVTVIYRTASERMTEMQSADDEIYFVVAEIVKSVQGWRPPDCYEPMRVLSEEFVGEQDGIWQWVVRFATKTLSVQTSESALNARLAEIQFDETFNS